MHVINMLWWTQNPLQLATLFVCKPISTSLLHVGANWRAECQSNENCNNRDMYTLPSLFFAIFQFFHTNLVTTDIPKLDKLNTTTCTRPELAHTTTQENHKSAHQLYNARKN